MVNESQGSVEDENKEAKAGKRVVTGGSTTERVDATPQPGGGRTLDFLCPFRDVSFFCPHVLSPRKPMATPKEAKLLLILGRPISETKVGCTRCEVFREVWKRKMTISAHLRFLLARLRWRGRSLSGSCSPV